MLALTDLAGADAYTLQHSIDVTVLGLVLGRRRPQPLRLAELPRRAHLHGRRRAAHEPRRRPPAARHRKARRPVRRAPEARHRSIPTSGSSCASTRMAGIELLPGHAISPLAKSVVRSHHERWDGSGYPEGRAGARIAQFARIASVADVYDAVTSARPYREAAPAHVGYQVIAEGAGAAFDPEVVDGLPQGRRALPGGHRGGVRRRQPRHRRRRSRSTHPISPPFASPTGPAACRPSPSTSRSPISLRSTARRRIPRPPERALRSADGRPHHGARLARRAPHRGRRPPRRRLAGSGGGPAGAGPRERGARRAPRRASGRAADRRAARRRRGLARQGGRGRRPRRPPRSTPRSVLGPRPLRRGACRPARRS